MSLNLPLSAVPTPFTALLNFMNLKREGCAPDRAEEAA